MVGQIHPNSNRLQLDYVHTNFTTKDGLLSNEVYCVFQDSKGYIWISTDKGVAKYDGYFFETFTTQDGLTDNVVLGIAEDSEGKIWFTTINKKLCYYKPNVGIKPYAYNYKILLERKQLLFEELNESRQMALSSQLNPHFVCNSLNSIQNFILTKRRELSSDYVMSIE